MARTIAHLARGTHRGVWKAWSLLLLAAFGLLTFLTGCKPGGTPVPVYGAPVVLYGPPFTSSTQ